MTAIDCCELETAAAELADERRVEAAEESISGDDEEHRSHAPLPWIGALPNPRLGPMVVVNDGGYSKLTPPLEAGTKLWGFQRGRASPLVKAGVNTPAAKWLHLYCGHLHKAR